MRKALLIFGLSWIILFCLLGVYLGVGFTAYTREARAALEAQDFSHFLEVQTSWKHKTSAHAHALCLSFLTLFLALLMLHMVLFCEDEGCSWSFPHRWYGACKHLRLDPCSSGYACGRHPCHSGNDSGALGDSAHKS